jgi:hypothetical protein
MLRAVALVAVLAGTPSAYAQMYKCVDESGVTHYSDKPRPGCKGGKVDIRPIPSVSGQTTAPPSDVARQDADFKRRRIELQEAEAKEKAALDQRCARLRRELEWLSSGVRISERDPQGQRVFVDDTTRDTRLAQVKERLRACP